MLQVLTTSKLMRPMAVKVLDFATTNCTQCCIKLINNNGLKKLFGLLSYNVQNSKIEENERLTSIIYNLLKQTAGPENERVVSKFKEANCSKLDTFMMFQSKYAYAYGEFLEDVAERKEEDVFVESMAGELYILSLINCCLALLLSSADKVILQHFIKSAADAKVSMDVLFETLKRIFVT
jgi:hypothetical protein